MKNLHDVIKGDLCCGCGACAYMCPQEISIVDNEDLGHRPVISGDSAQVAAAFTVCPGAGLAHSPARGVDHFIPELRNAWGPILGVWEGYATDPEIRFAGSSGGAITALALYCLERGGMGSVVHTAARSDRPYLNETVVSTSRQDLMRTTGSRYAPASPCEGLQNIEDADRPSVFVGKPCDVAAAQMARKIRPDLDAKMGLVVGFFCAGTPSTKGTLEMLKRMGVSDLDSLVSLRYRGNGWPGKATAVSHGTDGAQLTGQLTYEDSWGNILSHHQQWRCKLCADHTGEFADIAVGDPWYRPVGQFDPGRSLLLARTEHGREILLAAAQSGYLTIESADPRILPDSQPNLLRTRGALWGRLLACRLMGVAAPRFRNMPLLMHWWNQLSTIQKVKSIGGTMRRILRKKKASKGQRHNNHGV